MGLIRSLTELLDVRQEGFFNVIER